jgi:hypothetical protein
LTVKLYVRTFVVDTLFTKRKEFIQKTSVGISAASIGIAALKSAENSIKIDIQGFNHLPPQKPETMTHTVIHRANTRGHANHGWLDTHHTFSFSQYNNPERMQFGVLRVLNDDTIDGGTGFGTHPHQNMEIISIPLQGDIEHRDSMGNVQVIKENEIQVLSAGSGITHSEYNHNKDKKTNFLQIWVIPKKMNVAPRYDQQVILTSDRINKFTQILSPNIDDDGVWIHQDAWFSRGSFDQDKSAEYILKKSGNGVYIFIIDGDVEINGNALGKRDGIGFLNTDTFSISSKTKSDVLLMEVPMSI